MKLIRYFLLIFTIVPFSVNAQRIETEFFSIDLPEELHVENDNLRRIIASGPSMKPFVVIEYGKGITEQYQSISEDTSEMLEELGYELLESNCGTDCVSLTGNAVEEIDEGSIFVYIYMAKSKKISFVIVIGSPTAIDSGKLEITNIANQILLGK
ncbi:hypothetical protein OS175_15195 [Marinicella sp. S1101]|uniref:hypothetical protein n=1 Tax=Marinicella marina TaxID=2996016 RepID=UPI002260DF7A|nr:hypothetical protein [Marinicella marina]MCX7555215.1 hypothetical protein [Marinicella marina]MDJ1140677.1 hypothetical protein [Marinicella marina]